MQKKPAKSGHATAFFLLHILLVFYAFSGVLSKTAAQQPFLSIPFIACYGGMIAILAVYAVCWQQILKRLPLTVAFANKAATLVWSLVYGVLFFHETIRFTQLLGCALAMCGVILFVRADGEEQDDT